MDLRFLGWFPPGNAALSISASNGALTTIHGLNLEIIERKCPVLALSFEENASGIARASFDAESVDVVVHFLRFLYTGNYNGFGVEHPTLYMHAQLYQVGDVFGLPELQDLAYANAIVVTELACSFPTPLPELCEAIRFIYAHLAAQTSFIDTLLHYCASCFSQHNLGSNQDFRQVACELQSFHRDLCRTSIYRDFSDEGDSLSFPLVRSKMPG